MNEPFFAPNYMVTVYSQSTLVSWLQGFVSAVENLQDFVLRSSRWTRETIFISMQPSWSIMFVCTLINMIIFRAAQTLLPSETAPQGPGPSPASFWRPSTRIRNASTIGSSPRTLPARYGTWPCRLGPRLRYVCRGSCMLFSWDLSIGFLEHRTCFLLK